MAHLSSQVKEFVLCSKPLCIPFGASNKRLPLRRRNVQIIAAAEGKPDEKAKNTGPVSGEYKERLRDEYVGLGGAPNKPMGSNYFLWIIVIISALALASYLTGSV